MRAAFEAFSEWADDMVGYLLPIIMFLIMAAGLLLGGILAVILGAKVVWLALGLGGFSC